MENQHITLTNNQDGNTWFLGTTGKGKQAMLSDFDLAESFLWWGDGKTDMTAHHVLVGTIRDNMTDRTILQEHSHE